MPGEPSWLTVAEAARRMGVSTQALRARAKRGTLESRRDNRGRLLVLVDNAEVPDDASPAATMREQVAELKERLAASESARVELVAELATQRERVVQHERLIAHLEAELARRRWPGLRAMWRRLIEGEG